MDKLATKHPSDILLHGDIRKGMYGIAVNMISENDGERARKTECNVCGDRVVLKIKHRKMKLVKIGKKEKEVPFSLEERVRCNCDIARGSELAAKVPSLEFFMESNQVICWRYGCKNDLLFTSWEDLKVVNIGKIRFLYCEECFDKEHEAGRQMREYVKDYEDELDREKQPVIPVAEFLRRLEKWKKDHGRI